MKWFRRNQKDVFGLIKELENTACNINDLYELQQKYEFKVLVIKRLIEHKKAQ